MLNIKKILIGLLILTVITFQTSCKGDFLFFKHVKKEDLPKDNFEERISSPVKDLPSSKQFSPIDNKSACEESFAHIIEDEYKYCEITSNTVLEDINAQNIKKFNINSIITINEDINEAEILKKMQDLSKAISSRVNVELPNVHELRLSWLMSEKTTYANFTYEKIDGLLSLVNVSFDESLNRQNDN